MLPKKNLVVFPFVFCALALICLSACDEGLGNGDALLTGDALLKGDGASSPTDAAMDRDSGDGQTTNDGGSVLHPQNLPGPRARVALVREGNTLYAIGGTDKAAQPSSTINPLRDTLAFQASGKWVSRALAPEALSHHAAASSNGNIYVFCAIYRGGKIFSYTPKTNTWRTLAATTPLSDSCTALKGPDGAIYILGGADGSGAPVSHIYRFTSGDEKITVAGTLPRARMEHSVVLIKNEIFVIGGIVVEKTGTTRSATVDIYNPLANSWRVGPSLPQAITAAAAGANGTRIVIVGGFAPANRGNVAVSYVSLLDTSALNPAWVAQSELSGGTAYGGVGFPGGAIGPAGDFWIVGGYYRTTTFAWSVKSDVRAYNFATTTWR